MSRITSLLGLVAGLGLAACSIDKTAFHATPDGGSTGDDGGPSDVLAIVTSTQAVEMTENATADFTVKLSQAPAAPVEIDLSTASQKIGLSMQKLFFDATNFAQGQTVTVTGLPDDDTATETAEIKLSGAGAADVMVGATVHDPDTVTIVTDLSTTIANTVGEGKSHDVHVHLSHRPPGDVTVTAMLSSGPMTVSPPSQVFHMDDSFSSDVAFTISAPVDQNVGNEIQTITFAITGGDQKIFQLTDVDKDQLAITANPQSISHLLEGNSVTLNIALTLQPATDVTVLVATTTGQAQIGATAVTIKAAGNDYMVNHPVTITAPHDNNTTPETDTIVLSIMNHPEVTSISIPVQIDDADVQAIQTTVLNSLTVTEGMQTSFGVTLKFAPPSGGSFTVNLATMDPLIATASGPGGANFLTFDATNYNNPAMHPVTVQGTQDNNLITNSTVVKLTSVTPPLETDVNVDVLDDDHEAFVLSQTTPLTVPEGASKMFTVALAFQPTTTVQAQLSSTDAALQVTPATIDFSTTNWNAPVTVTVTAPVDKNNVSEMATIAVASAPASPVVPTVSLIATAMDVTMINNYGWPVPPAFTGSFAMQQGQVIAYKVTVPNTASATMLDTMSVNVPTASADFRMALYTDNGNTPGTLVNAAQFLRRTLVNGANTVDIADVALPAGSYWIALRVSGPTGLSAGDATQMGVRCTRQFNINSLDDAWPVSFGTSDCVNNNLFNFWITTYHQ